MTAPRSIDPSSIVPRRCRNLSTLAVASRLGVSVRSIRLWAECGEIPAIKIGRGWYSGYGWDDSDYYISTTVVGFGGTGDCGGLFRSSSLTGGGLSLSGWSPVDLENGVYGVDGVDGVTYEWDVGVISQISILGGCPLIRTVASMYVLRFSL